MAIANRDLDPSEQIRVIDKNIGALATGVTTLVAMVENTEQVVAAALRAYGLSGSPVYSLNILRQVGAAVTLIPLGATITATDGAAASYQSFSLTLGATNFMQVGDVLMLNSGAANTAVTGLQLTVCLKALQDVKTYFGNVIS